MSESHGPDGGGNVSDVGSGQVLEKLPPELKKWRCEQCTFENKPKNRYCEVCLMKNTSIKSAQKTPKLSSIVKEEAKQHQSQNKSEDNLKSDIDVTDETLPKFLLPEISLPIISNSVSVSDNLSSEMDHKPIELNEETVDKLPEPNDNGTYEITCTKCTYNNPREFRFCDICGTQLDQSAAFRNAKSPVKGTRRLSISRPMSEAKKPRKHATSGSQISESQEGDSNDDRSKKRGRELADIETPSGNRRQSNTTADSDVDDENEEISDKNDFSKKSKPIRKIESNNRIPTSPSPRKQPASSSSQAQKRPSSSKPIGANKGNMSLITNKLINKSFRSSNSSSQGSVKQSNNHNGDRVTRADRAAEMQAIYEQFYLEPPPLKRGMVIVWNCNKCNLENAIREKNCLQCNALQVSRFHYVALCTHYKALEGRRLKRLNEQDENGDTFLTMVTGKSKLPNTNQNITVSNKNHNNNRNESRPSNAGHNSSNTIAMQNDNGKRTNSSAKSRRHVRGSGEPRKPRVPIILQYPPKEPKIGPDYQVDIETLPNPSLFIKQKMDYSVYFDHLSDEQVPLDELSPWQYNNPYYDVLWLTTEYVQYKHQPLPLSQLNIGAERFHEDETYIIPPPLPALFIDDVEKVANDSSVTYVPPQIEQTSTETASSIDVDEATVSLEDAATLPIDSSLSTTLQNDEIIPVSKNEKAISENKEGSSTIVSDSMDVVSHVVLDVVAEVEKSIDVKMSVAMTSTSFTVLAYPFHSVSSRESIATSAVASLDATSGQGTVSLTCEDNLIRGMSSEQLTRHYPILALQSLFQHQHILDDVYADIKSTVLQRHSYVSRPHITDLKPAIPLELDQINTNDVNEALQSLEKHTQLFSQCVNLSNSEVQLSEDVLEKQPIPTIVKRNFCVGPLDTPILELSSTERNRFQQALIRYGNDEWNLVAKFLDYDYTVGQLQDYYYGTWTTKYRSLAQMTERMHRSYKRSLSVKRPRRVGTSRELSNLLLDQERGMFMNDFGGRISSKKRDKRREEEGVSIVEPDRERKRSRNDEEEEEDYRVGEEDAREEQKDSRDDDSNLEDQESEVHQTAFLDTIDEEESIDDHIIKRPRYISDEIGQDDEEKEAEEEQVIEEYNEDSDSDDDGNQSESNMDEHSSVREWEEEENRERGDIQREDNNDVDNDEENEEELRDLNVASGVDKDGEDAENFVENFSMEVDES